MPPIALRQSRRCKLIDPRPYLANIPRTSYTNFQFRAGTNASWRPVSILDEYAILFYDFWFQKLTHDAFSWVAKEARPISLRQLMVFGRSLTESRLISSANYVRTELPTR